MRDSETPPFDLQAPTLRLVGEDRPPVRELSNGAPSLPVAFEGVGWDGTGHLRVSRSSGGIPGRSAPEKPGWFLDAYTEFKAQLHEDGLLTNSSAATRKAFLAGIYAAYEHTPECGSCSHPPHCGSCNTIYEMYVDGQDAMFVCSCSEDGLL